MRNKDIYGIYFDTHKASLSLTKVAPSFIKNKK